MRLKALAAIAACKISKGLLRLLKRGGTTLPGRIALKICPDVLGFVSRDVRCIIITGTNGKTTTSRIVEEMCVQAGLPCISNRSGANLITGITTEFISNCSLFGNPKKRFAVIETDEAASKEVCRQIKPEIILVTNLFRDQLDRYGEVTYTLANVITGIKNSPDSLICLNADCSLTASIAGQVPNKALFFGVDVPIYVNQIDEASDAPFCINCKHEYAYSYRTFAHLGGFSCPKCGFSRPKPDVSVTQILDLGMDSSTVRVNICGDEDEFIVNLPGGYNIYNAAAALAVCVAANFDREAAKCAIAGFNCGFGRMERFDMGKTSARMILVKNPAGCNQALNFLCGLSEETVFVCCLNDRIADGTDISWIWDVNFERLSEMGETLSAVYVSGVRRAEMALRLKYSGLPLEKVRMFDDYDALISAMSGQELPVVIMPTYTAMMELREKFLAVFGGKDFWE